jgi:NTE family protein
VPHFCYCNAINVSYLEGFKPCGPGFEEGFACCSNCGLDGGPPRGAEKDQPRAPGRRRAWRVHLGVLDRLLEDGRLTIEGVSGASAGAVNAVMLADGLARGGREEARKRLAEFWRAASIGGNLPTPQRAVLDRLLAFFPIQGLPMQTFVDNVSRFLSPYDLNPLDINPLKDLITRSVDFDAVRVFTDLRLFVSATNVHTGVARVFTREEITAEVVMASAALPFVFKAVEIDGVPYWDGGYSGNPAILPLVQNDVGTDVLVVQINPVERAATPTSARDILHRINEITFNSSLAAELNTIALIGQLIDKGQLKPAAGYRRVNLHRIALSGRRLSEGGRLKTDYDFFEMLHRAGRRAARRFLDEHFDDIGARSTIEKKTKAA